MNFAVRRAVKTDAAQLSHLASSVFSETYGSRLSPALLAAHLDEELSAPAIGDDLTDERSTYWVAEQCRAVVGFLKLRSGVVPPPHVRPRSLELAKLYVSTEVRGSGIADRLLDAALASVDRHSHDAVWLLVWEENRRAVAFYARAGFATVGRQDVMVGQVAFHDWVMQRELGASDDR